MLSQLPFDRGILKAIENLGYSVATPVQAQAIPVALQKKDLLVSAETGSGKTAAFILPILQQLVSVKPSRDGGTLALILVPTRELARQVYKYCQQLSVHTAIRAGIITGGENFKYQKSMIRKNPEIIIATPGRLLEHIEKTTIDLNSLQFLVLDEADRMLDMGFSDDVLTITSQCNRARQSMLFSATLHHKGIRVVAEQVLLDYETIIVNEPRQQHSQIKQQIILADDITHKQKLISFLLKNESFQRALVFSNTRIGADKLGNLIRYNKIRAGVLHGDMSQDDRKKVMDFFTQGKINVLIATDLAARGLDVKGIDLVINMDMARSGDDYLHRIGRTGRAGEIGLAISLIAANEWNLMASIERYLNSSFERRAITELKANFKGPKKLKASGKAAGSKKKKSGHDKNTATKKLSGQKSTKKPQRVSKTRANLKSGQNDGFSPIKKKF